MDDCIFCLIAAGTIPAEFLWEDEGFVAFRDLHPQMPVHVLIIPREHYSGLGADVPPAVLGGLLAAAPLVAAAVGVAGSGYRVIINTGADAGQTVPHLHMHLLGGAPMAEGMVTPA
jgi:histidine triad (HIT) family protein